SAGFIGKAYGGSRPDGGARQNLRLGGSMTLERLGNRQELLTSLDSIRRDADSSGMMNSMDSFTQRAVNLVTSGELARALDMTKEDPRNKERYGIDQHNENTRFLMGRRLISAGVRCVALSWGGWDTHGDNFGQMRRQLPPLSKALAALIEDLDAQGRLDDTIIMMSGEFGRTPRINGGGGRGHLAPASVFFLPRGRLPPRPTLPPTPPPSHNPQPPRRWCLPPGQSHRHDHTPRRNRQGPAVPHPQHLLHGLQTARYRRRRGDVGRSERPAAIPRRSPRAGARAGVNRHGYFQF